MMSHRSRVRWVRLRPYRAASASVSGSATARLLPTSIV
jgi:hypothetical protein